ncbi:hypothetical protein [Labrys wisconsinensis]|uniref:Uncharacterized protein n=1 Tax=Labrys wisconsinensis TaxID=425677 RepID=A0ABU0J0Q8_9HYPH|nr:hypothetical protein [Labrys wisconsinensis]MDQ0467131.1 hypothetical protein [Labrys wisconsinensis]
MGSYFAIVLICASTLARDACNEKTAADVLSIKVASELACTQGWQEIVARSALNQQLGSTSYLKTVCRRVTRVLPPAAE